LPGPELLQPQDLQVEPLAIKDESRVGLLPIPRRCITFTGVKPLGMVQSHCENFYRYGAAEPTTGESFLLEPPHLNATNLQIFLHGFSHCPQETLNIVLMDSGNGHQAKSLVIPDHGVYLFSPSYSPELNPIELLWQDVKDQLAWVRAAAIRALTSYPDFGPKVKAVCS
jgi:transposase